MTVTTSSKTTSTPATAAPPRGRPVSGRVWKKVQKTRFSSQGVKSAKVLSSTWDEKLLKRAKLKELKELQTDIKDRRQAERDAKRQAREEKEKRRKENELKSASVQVVRSRSHSTRLRCFFDQVSCAHGIVLLLLLWLLLLWLLFWFCWCSFHGRIDSSQ